MVPVPLVSRVPQPPSPAENLRLDATAAGKDGTVRVTVDVASRGPVAGDEVVQVYVSSPGSAVTRAPRSRSLPLTASFRVPPG